jgi:hypothetical protein
MAVGHAVSIYHCSLPASNPRRTRKEAEQLHRELSGSWGPAYQVMRWNESEGPGKAFRKWHILERPQWYDTPEAACAAYVASHRQWLTNHPGDA